MFETTPLPNEAGAARETAAELAHRIRDVIVARLAPEEPPDSLSFSAVGWAGVAVAGVGLATLIAAAVTGAVANGQASAVVQLADGTYVNQVAAAAALARFSASTAAASRGFCSSPMRTGYSSPIHETQTGLPMRSAPHCCSRC